MRFRGGIDTAAVLAHLSPLLSAGESTETVFPRLPPRLFSLNEPGFDPDFGAGDDPGTSLVAVATGTRLELRRNLRAALLITELNLSDLPDSIPVLRVRNVRAALATILRAFSAEIQRDIPNAAGDANTVHPSAVVEGILEGGVTVGAGVFVGFGSHIGSGTRLEANSVIREHCVIGRTSLVQSGAVVGCAGFGFYGGDGENAAPELMPHLAGVRIGADCFIGANTVVAAGVLHPTVIGDGCKLDSHVQIAHNVRLGAGSMLASQSGIAGSTVIGDGFRMGGAASVAGHLQIGRAVSVAAKAGVTKDVPDGMTVAGFPARPIAQWRRNLATQTRLGRNA